MTSARPAGMLGAVILSKFFGGFGMLVALGVAGCTGGTETGNPSFTGALSYTGYSSAPDDYGVRTGGRVATVQRAWFDLAEVEISSSGACGVSGGRAFTVAALGVGDHAAGNHNFTAFEAEAGEFCSVLLPFTRVPASDRSAPAELRGRAILLEGVLSDGTRFSIASDAAPRLELAGRAGGFAISDKAAQVVFAFDFAAWLRDVDFSAAELTAGVAVVSRDANPALLETFERSLASGVALYRDRDGDGQVDDPPELLARTR